MANTNEDTRFVVQIDNQPFYIEVWMYNQLDPDKFPKFSVPFFFIKGLVIEESLMEWNVKGWIVLSNDFEVFERGSLPYNGEDNKAASQAPFLFRSDGRNKISIKIYPITGQDGNIDSSDNNIPREQWEMYYDFVIYDIEDLNTNSASKKLRKFYFHDEKHQIFSERNIEWSTALFSSAGSVDADRTLKAAALSTSKDNKSNKKGAIESIIETAASNDSNKDSPIVKVGSKQGPSGIDSPDIPLNSFDVNNWDIGEDDTDVLYTSPANASVLYDIEYVSKSLKASDGSPMFLRYDRYNRLDGKKWSMVPLSKYIIDAEKNQVERIVIQDGLDPTLTPPYVPRAPFDINSDANSMIKNFQSGIASKINNYKFSPMVATDDSRLTNAPIHNFDFSEGQFDIVFKGNTVKDLMTNMGDMANKGLFGYKNNGSQQLMLNINKTKNTGLSHSNNFIPRTFYPKTASYLSMAKDFIFLNQALYFSSPGLTLRTPGKFLFVDRDTSSDSNPFDDRFLGQWMITNVVHFFSTDKYTTDVVATKIDGFKKWWEVIDTKADY